MPFLKQFVFRKLLLSLMVFSLVGMGLLIFSSIYYQNSNYYYFIWNLFLAWVPLIFGYILIDYLKNNLWSSWRGLGLTFLWLIFLPNAFYMISDYVHLNELSSSDVLYFAVSFSALIINAVLLGFLSVYFIHKELRKRLNKIRADIILIIVFLACSYAIYVGRVLRWNSWDLITNPGGIIYDVSDQILNLKNLLNSAITTLMFFSLLVTLYIILYNGVNFLIIDLGNKKS